MRGNTWGSTPHPTFYGALPHTPVAFEKSDGKPIPLPLSLKNSFLSEFSHERLVLSARSAAHAKSELLRNYFHAFAAQVAECY
ncbi:MAG: hypothetical protein IJO48_00720 [Clostridia bacterium]|nr:hypothetical protein [Clostridia bacterium]